jgi:hypothetical protein
MITNQSTEQSYMQWLEKRQRDRASGVGSNVAEYLWAARKRRQAQRALSEIDPGAAQYAQNVSEADAWGVYLEHGLVTREELERARELPGNTLWNYSGQG